MVYRGRNSQLSQVVFPISLSRGVVTFPGVGNRNLLQYSCLENSMDREEPGGLPSTGLEESDTTEMLNTAQHSLSSLGTAACLSEAEVVMETGYNLMFEVSPQEAFSRLLQFKG